MGIGAEQYRIFGEELIKTAVTEKWIRMMIERGVRGAKPERIIKFHKRMERLSQKAQSKIAPSVKMTKAEATTGTRKERVKALKDSLERLGQDPAWQRSQKPFLAKHEVERAWKRTPEGYGHIQRALLRGRPLPLN